MSQLVFTHCNPEEVDPKAHEVINLLVRLRATRQRTKISFFHFLYIGLPPERVAQIKGGCALLKDLD